MSEKMTWRRINKEKLSLFKPCEDRWQNYLKHYDDFDGDIAEFLMLDKITAKDKIWVAVRVMPRHLVEVFAVDCAFAAYDAYAAYAAAYDAYAAYADAYAAYADAAAYAAAYAAYAASAAYAADYAAYAAAYDAYADASAAAAYAAASAADYAQERENQVDALLMIIEGEG